MYLCCFINGKSGVLLTLLVRWDYGIILHTTQCGIVLTTDQNDCLIAQEWLEHVRNIFELVHL